MPTGPEDIYNGNLKLIMGLIWTLIRRFQIRSTGQALTTKDAMLAWVNTQIPDQKIRNFTTDWNDGVALCALVDRIRPGACPQYATLDRANKVENCRLGMSLAEEKINIPSIMEAEDLSHRDIDDMSVMTYISYFCKPANERLLQWVQSKIPDRNITNFQTDWNNGINLACLLNVLNPGIFPDCKDLDPHKSLDNLVRAMKIAEETLGVKPVIKPSQLADPNVDELNVVTYLSRFQYAKPIPQPHEVTCNGHGLYKAFVGRAAIFNVDASRGGVGDLNVMVTFNGGGHLEPEIKPSTKQKGFYEVSYVPSSGGKLTIEVKWGGFVIPASPFSVDVLNPGEFRFTGKEITGGECAKVGQQVTMQAKGLVDVADLHVMIQHADGHTETASIVPKDGGQAECSYTPVRVGVDEVFVKVAGSELPGSPFEVKVVDPNQCSVSLRDPPAGKPLLLNEKATFVVTASVGNLHGTVTEVKGPRGVQEVTIIPQGNGTSIGDFVPVEVGNYEILVTCAGESVRGSPIELVVSNPSKCAFLDPLPEFMQVKKPCTVNLSSKDAGPGKVEVQSSEPSILAFNVTEGGYSNLHAIELIPNAIGDSNFEVKWNGSVISSTPRLVHVCDASKCSAYGQALNSGQGKTKEAFEFTVQTKGAGSGELTIKPRGPKSVYGAEIKKNSHETYTVKFTSYELGPHSIDILWGGEHIPNSPYKVEFVKAADAGQFTATGDGLKQAIALQTAKCMIVGPESGLVESGVLSVKVTGDSYDSETVSKAEFDPQCGQPVVCVSDNRNGSYQVEYAVPQAGKHTLFITSNGENIPQSPFNITVLSPPNASQCVAFGHAIDNPKSLVVGRPLEFKVDATNSGTGQLTVTATDPASSSVAVFLAENGAADKKKIYSLKIDPKLRGKYKVNVLWSEKHIPKSPFTFQVSDPRAVVLLDLPDASNYIARVKEPVRFAVDTSKAGKGELKCAAKLSTGNVESFEKKVQPDGTTAFRYVPKVSGRMELLLTFNGISILPERWECEIANPSEFKVVPPKGYGKQKEYVKFTITGLTPKNKKNMQITSKHKEHDATVKVDYSDDRVAVARFTAKQIGEYIVEVKVAKKHIEGSPFRTLVVNPEGCRVRGKIPDTIPVGHSKHFQVNTANAGPGKMTFELQNYSTEPTDCLDCEFMVNATHPQIKQVNLKGVSCSRCLLYLKWGGHNIPDMPADVNVVDPIMCSFSCEQIESGTVKTTDELIVLIDTSQGGDCTPEVAASGPKTAYNVNIEKTGDGQFTARYSPWQEGEQTLQVLVGGAPIKPMPVSFEAIKPVDPSKVTVSGPGLKQAIANRRTEVTIFAQESQLFERGMLKFTFGPTQPQEDQADPETELYDNQDGTYTISFAPRDAGAHQLTLTNDQGEAIKGSPFSITVLPEPNPSMCKIVDKAGEPIFRDGSEIYHLLNTPVVLTVDTTDAGTGSLCVSGTEPDQEVLRVFTNTGTVEERTLSYLKFDPNKVGTYTLNLTWDNTALPGSPFSIRVVDPSKCHCDPSFPAFLQMAETKSFSVIAQGAGEAELDVCCEGIELVATVNKVDSDTYTVTLEGSMVGITEVNVMYGGFAIPKSPFTISVCDPSKCIVDLSSLKDKLFQVGVPFTFTVATQDAGNDKLYVKPVDPEKQYTNDVKDLGDGNWEVTCTAWNTGKQELQLVWGEWEIEGSPLSFSVFDPKKIVITGLPDPQNYVAIMGEPISFTVDCSEAGEGSLNCYVSLPDESTEDVDSEETDLDTANVSILSLIPKQPGKLQLYLKYNDVDILPSVCIYEVPDPTLFKVTPPKGYGKLNEQMKIAITGVKADTELTINATHTEEEAEIKTEPGKDESTVIASFTAQHIGEYEVSVQHAGQHIDGSPFKSQIADPDKCTFVGELPGVIHVGEEVEFQVDTSAAGPGSLSIQTEVLSGDIEPNVSEVDEEGKFKVSIPEGIGLCHVKVKWADYNIPSSPFTLSVVDSTKVVLTCETMTTKRGDDVKILVNGINAGQASPEVTASGPKSSFAVQTTDNKDGTFLLALNPWQIGENEVNVLWGGKPVPDSPIMIQVMKEIEASSITANGVGLHSAVAQHPAVITINSPDKGLIDRGVLNAKFVGDTSESLPKFDLEDKDDGTYQLTFVAETEGEYELDISCEEKPIVGSPFKIHVSAAPDAHKCKAFGDVIEKLPCSFIVPNPIGFSVDSTEAGDSQLTVSASQPNGGPLRVYTLDESGEKRLHHLKFDTNIIGHYNVSVKWGGVEIPGSPFDFNLVDPTKCIVDGLPPPNKIAQINAAVHFTVQSQDAGDEVPKVVVTQAGESEPLALTSTSTESDSTLAYVYSPQAYGNTNVSVKLGSENVPGSPFKFVVVDPNKFSVASLNIKGDYALACEVVSILITGKEVETEDDKLLVTAHGPSADLNVDTAAQGNDSYVANFVPIEPGSYELFVEYSGAHINGSPFTVKVVDPSKCQILGDVPTMVQVGETEEFVLKSRGAGKGGLKVLIDGKETHAAVECKIENQGLDTYAVKITGKDVDDVSIELQWAGFKIPQGPFKISVCDASKCKVYGQALITGKSRVGEPITFSVVTLDAGNGKLSVLPKGPSAQYTVDAKETKDSTYEVSFTPWEVGEHTIAVIWATANVPNSPFAITIENAMETNVCNATGEGLKHAIAGQTANFTIISSEIGLVEKNALKVSVIGVQAQADVTIKDNNNGCYAVDYIPPTPGAYVAKVTYYDSQIPGSPFKVNVFPGPDASKCRVGGPALHPNSLHIAGNPLELTVDTTEAGYGQLRVYVQGPNDYRPRVFSADDDKGNYLIKFDAMKAGRYYVVVAWSDNHVPGSPFKIRVHPAADASKVKAFGPGLLDGFLGTPGKSRLDTFTGKSAYLLLFLFV